VSSLGDSGNVVDWRVRERDMLRTRIERGTYTEGGILYWTANKRPVPMYVFHDADVEAPAGQAAASRAYAEAALAEYRQRRDVGAGGGGVVIDLHARKERGG
jgi:hypothetical protein